MKHALCIGHLSYDITLPMEGYPEENAKYQIDRTLESSGGPASNAAALLAQWGIPTAFIGTVGLDSYGERALQDLQEAGVDLRGVSRKASCATPLSIILVNTRTGSRTIINRKGGSTISQEETETLFSHLDSSPPDLLLLDGHEPEASLTALAHFPSALSILDAGSFRRGTELLAPRVTYCIASERFAREILALQEKAPGSTLPNRESAHGDSAHTSSTVDTGATAPTLPYGESLHKDSAPSDSFSSRKSSEVKAAPSSSSNRNQHLYGRLLAALASFGIPLPIVTLGEEGCCFLYPEYGPQGSRIGQGNGEPEESFKPRGFHLLAYPAKAIDTTGAGDIFHGAFAAFLLGGTPFLEALRFATVAAGLSVERLGGKPSIPRIEEVLKQGETWIPTWNPIPLP
jgi:sugar/nucleoside kinase (ribokinase family)